jgi:hypothetical protein
MRGESIVNYSQWDEIHAETEDPARIVRLLRGLQEKVM